MRRLGLISAALLLLLTLPAFGQRGGHGGGFGSFGGGFHGGSGGRSFSGSYSGVPAQGAVGVSRSGIPAFGAVGVRPYFNGNMRSQGFNQGAFHRGAGGRWPYRPYRGWGFAPWYGYGYGYGAYLGPNLVGYPFGFDDFDDDDLDDASAAQQGPDYASPYSPNPYSEEAPPAENYYPPPPAEAPYADDYSQLPYAGAYSEVPYAGAHSGVPYAGAYSDEASPPEVAADGYRPPYQGSSQASSASEQPVRPQPATTLIFNNGWPNLQVHNYILTRTTLYDLDGSKQREIPLDEINVPATKKTNRSTGVNFAPPAD